jgi:glycyl-tRNA synthetase
LNVFYKITSIWLTLVFRYRRQDEIGTPECVTVDFDTLNDRCVTVRQRDSMTQARIPIAQFVESLSKSF